MASPLLRKARAFRRLSGQEKRVVLRLLPSYVVVQTLLPFVSLPRLSTMLGIRLAEKSTLQESGAIGGEISAVVRAASRLVGSGHGKARCLKVCLIAGNRLRSHRPVLQIGVAGSGPDRHAHAWLEVDGHPLEDVKAFTVLSPAAKP